MQKHSQEEGLRKLICSSELPDAVGAGMNLIEDPAILCKTASPIFKLSDEKLRPPPGFVGIHTVALGDWERYGMNRNGDTFPKLACETYYPTFVKHGHVFRNHKNRDPKEAIGKIAAAAYNEPMGRIELVIWADEKKAAPELHKLAEDGDHAFSMACKVPNDRCTVCNQLRKSAMDPNQCEHIRDNLGHTMRDGTAIGTHNDHPTWFDESFVGRGADRISWNLDKIASERGEIVSSIKLAEAAGIWVPDEIENNIPGYKEKSSVVEKLAEFEEYYLGLAATGRRETHRDMYMWELRKAANCTLDDAQIDKLRDYDPTAVFQQLTHDGIVLDAQSFFKYSMGLDYGDLAGDMDDIMHRVRDNLFMNLHKSGAYQRVCRNSYFDVDISNFANYAWAQDTELATLGRTKLASATSFIGTSVDQRIIDATIQGKHTDNVVTLNKQASYSPAADRAAEIYGAYKVSTVNGILSYHKQTNVDALLGLAAAQDLVR